MQLALPRRLKWVLNIIVQMDCDFSHDPKEIKTLLSECQSKDLVIGSRYVGGIRIINASLTDYFST